MTAGAGGLASSQTSASAPPTTAVVTAGGVDGGEIRLKLLKWLFFEVAFALLALVFNWADGAIHGMGFGLAGALGRGEFLLVAAAVVAAGVGDLVKGGLNSRIRGTKISLIGSGMAIVASSAWFYAEVATPGSASSGIDQSVTVVVSACVGLVSFVLSIACLIAAEVR
jgi:hypothetical protein